MIFQSLSLLVIFCSMLQAATPSLWINENNKRVPLRVESIDARVNLVGQLAETTLTLRFINPTDRIQEGEFVMPLPEGSTVSSYALEVNGALRDGVAVEKKQARRAYEIIKRGLIDPGLIEREANNTYRTRVFPIPAKGTKTVRISYIERMRLINGQLSYVLPANYPGEVPHFLCSIHYGAKTRVATGSGSSVPQVRCSQLDFIVDDDGVLTASRQNVKITEDIQLTWPPSPSPIMIVENEDSELEDGEGAYFMLHHSLPAEVVESIRNAPAHINIIWDASDSARSLPHARLLELLDRYFKQLAIDHPDHSSRVTVQLLRHELQEGGEFIIRAGRWEKLKAALLSVYYDGSTAYSSMAQQQHAADLTLLFTDAEQLPDQKAVSIQQGQTTFVFHRGGDKAFQAMTHPRFGGSFDVRRADAARILRSLTRTHYRLEAMGLGDQSVLSTKGSFSQQRLILGRYQKGMGESIKLNYANGNQKKLTQRVAVNQVEYRGQGRVIRRFWAQEKLNQLEEAGNDVEAVLTHCRRYGLVSDYTSLIVLERFRDYVRFDIPPPEPELRQRWRLAREKYMNDRKPTAKEGQAAGIWQLRLSWYNNPFYSWRSKTLINQYAQSGLWFSALNQFFEKADIKPDTFALVESWNRKNKKHVEEEGLIKSRQSYQAWREREEELVRQWQGFADATWQSAASGPLAVSIRGLVMEPKTYRQEGSLTLKQSLTLAGGLHPSGSLRHISLYRNGHAQTHNLLSKRYEDIPLLPGDMIVAEPDWGAYAGSDCDPFSSAPSEPMDPAEQPAVSSRPVVNQTAVDPFGGRAEGGRPQRPNPELNVGVRLLPLEPRDLANAEWLRFKRQLQQGREAWASYQLLKKKAARSSRFYLKAAHLLQEHEQPTLARQVLSNISELKPMSAVTDRELAYCLGEIGQWKEAWMLLKKVQQAEPASLQSRLDELRYRSVLNPDTDRFSAYQSIIDQYRNQTIRQGLHEGLALALTERNACPRPKSLAEPLSLGDNLVSDIRCVVYSSDPSVHISLQMQEPSGDSVYQNGQVSAQGGRLFRGRGMNEYMLRRAMPGRYLLEAYSSRPVTLQLAVYTHWGTAKQQVSWTTIQLEGLSRGWAAKVPLAELNFDFTQ